jgi:ParB family chromosome partitioning protein
MLSLENPRMQKKLRDMILSEGLSVRQAEERASRIAMDNIPREGQAGKKSRHLDEDAKRLREQLIEAFACRVDVKSSAKDRGKIEIYYDSLDELERILNRVRVEA